MATHTPVPGEVFVVAHSHSLKQDRASSGPGVERAERIDRCLAAFWSCSTHRESLIAVGVVPGTPRIRPVPSSPRKPNSVGRRAQVVPVFPLCGRQAVIETLLGSRRDTEQSDVVSEPRFHIAWLMKATFEQRAKARLGRGTPQRGNEGGPLGRDLCVGR